MKSTSLIALLVLGSAICAATAEDSIRRVDENEALLWDNQPQPGLLSTMWNAVASYVYPETETAIDEAFSSLPKHWARIASLIQAVMDRAANTPEKRVSLIDEALGHLRLTSFDDYIRVLRDDFDSKAFLARMGECGHKNEYLTTFMEKAAFRDFYSGKTDADDLVPRALAYAVVLDRITFASRQDWHVFETLHQTLGAVDIPWTNYANAFERAKKRTIDHVMGQYLDMHRSRKVPGDWGRRTLPLNICEACLEDFRLDVKDNAQAGLAIAFERPGEENFNFKTHAGPTTMSPDGNAVLYRCPLPSKYAGMYSTWNSAFVSHYDDAPFFWAKLFTPQVACYHDDPEEYIYNRAIALFVHIHFTLFSRFDNKSTEPKYKWSNRELTLNWARHNLIQAGLYEKALEDASGESQSWAKAKIKRVMDVFGQASAADLDLLLNFGASITSGECDNMSLASFLKAASAGGKVTYELMKALILA